MWTMGSTLTSKGETRTDGGTHSDLSMRAWVTGTTCTVSARLRLLVLASCYGQNLPFRELCRDFQLFDLHTEVLPGLSLPLQ
eukprot:3427860-Amphidinium_carterae.1